MAKFDLTPGARVTRAQLNTRYGGGIQGGMLTPAGGELMFLFSDPVSGETYGYTTDGWADSDRNRYFYTGEGAYGPQTIASGANKILLETLSDSRDVHLFYAVDYVDGSKTRIHEYLGQFELDAAQPWHSATTIDASKEPRTAVVFNLVRIDGATLPPGDEYVNADVPASETQVTTIEREAADKTEFQRAAVPAGLARRRERELEDRLIDFLASKGQTAKRLRIKVVGEAGALYTDSWVPSTLDLYEVKGDATRNDIRMAVAQLLDYSRHINPSPARSTIIVPIDPTPDLIRFVESVGVYLAVFDKRGLTYIVGTGAEA